ncbi:MAG: aminopeptidase P family protein [Candidatus Rokubacteria bacterium]|nr:aminopeptidase P family protein [Candidatus Rokubacteria bacterium]
MITEQGRALATRSRIHQLRVPNLNEIDFARLRAGRLARLQLMMKRYDLPVCLFYNPANIRYATGTDVMGVWTAGTFSRYCIVPAEGAPILFEYKGSIHVSQKLLRDVRPAYTWQFGGSEAREKAREWAASVRSLLKELGLERARLAIDKLDTLGFLALQEEGIPLADSSPATVDAREVKTAEEIELCTINGAIGDAILAEFEAAIRPGVREYELLAVLAHALLKRHGEFLFTRLVASGTNTNPWMSEAHDKLVMPGDLVGVDTDANGYEGYVIDVSRTFLCGDTPSPEQREAYRVAYDCVTGMVELVRPGMTFEEFASRAPRLPEAYRAQRYPTMVHQAGLEDEGPGIPYPDDDRGPRRIMPQREIKEGMVLCLECYAGKVGAAFGVKLEDQVLVTRDGTRLLCTYPYDAKLLS